MTEEPISGAMKNLSLQQPATQTTPQGQYAASSFCDHVPSGFGYLPTITRFDPTIQVCAHGQALTDKLVPTADDVSNAPVLRISGELPAFQPVKEVAEGGILEKTMTALQFLDCFVDNGQTRFSKHGLSVGLAKDNSYNDIHASFDGLYTVEFASVSAKCNVGYQFLRWFDGKRSSKTRLCCIGCG